MERTVAEMWQEYAAKCLPKYCSDFQRGETEQAFYAGIFVALHSQKVDIMNQVSPQVMGASVRRWYDEAKEYHQRRIQEYVERN